MASTAVFVKVAEDDGTVTYVCGADDEARPGATLVLDKAARRLLEPEDPTYTVRKAAGKILQLERESGIWPERGSSVS